MDFLEEFEINGQEFLRILSEIVQQFLDLRCGLVEAVVHRRIFYELAGRSFSVLDGVDETIECGNSGPEIFIELVVCQQFSECPLAAVDSLGDSLKRGGQTIEPVI